LEDEDVLVDQQAGGLATRHRAAGVVELPQGRSGEQGAVADGGQQRDDVLQVLVAGLLGEPDGLAGQVEHVALAAWVAGDGDQQPAGPQDLEAAGIHPGHLVQVGGAAGVAEDGGVEGVVLGVASAETAAVSPGVLVDGCWGAGEGRGGGDQVDRAGQIPQDRWEAAGVTDADLAEAGLVGGQRHGEVAAGQVGPARLQFDADAATAEAARLDQDGADAAHRVHDQPAGWGVFGGDAAGELWQHLGGMGAGGGHIAAGALGMADGLRARPHRQRNRLGRLGGARGLGRRAWCHGLAQDHRLRRHSKYPRRPAISTLPFRRILRALSAAARQRRRCWGAGRMRPAPQWSLATEATRCRLGAACVGAAAGGVPAVSPGSAREQAGNTARGSAH
jgi:hypothetical protein